MALNRLKLLAEQTLLPSARSFEFLQTDEGPLLAVATSHGEISLFSVPELEEIVVIDSGVSEVLQIVSLPKLDALLIHGKNRIAIYDFESDLAFDLGIDSPGDYLPFKPLLLERTALCGSLDEAVYAVSLSSGEMRFVTTASDVTSSISVHPNENDVLIASYSQGGSNLKFIQLYGDEMYSMSFDMEYIIGTFDLQGSQYAFGRNMIRCQTFPQHDELWRFSLMADSFVSGEVEDTPGIWLYALQLAFSVAGQLLFLSSTRAELYVIDVKSPRVLEKLSPHDRQHFGFVLCQDGRYLATIGNDAKLKLWSVV